MFAGNGGGELCPASSPDRAHANKTKPEDRLHTGFRNPGLLDGRYDLFQALGYEGDVVVVDHVIGAAALCEIQAVNSLEAAGDMVDVGVQRGLALVEDIGLVDGVNRKQHGRFLTFKTYGSP